LAGFLLREGRKRWHLIGSDYIYPRESNRIMRDVVEQQGGEITAEVYLPYEVDTGALARAVDAVKLARPDVVFCTLVGRPGREFYRLYRELGIDPNKIPIASLTMVEGEIDTIGPELCCGHYTSATYFGSLDNPENNKFVTSFHERFGVKAPVSMWAEGAYSQVMLFARALEIAGTLDTQKLVAATLGVRFNTPSGEMRIDADNHHAWLRPRIGRIRKDGTFDVVWQSSGLVKPDPYLTMYGISDISAD
jgi:branched-chain amino acid transport system substrate-binding protein